MTGIYDDPWAYELACSFRDVEPEVDAVLAWCRRHGAGAPGSVLELAAGPAEHARAFARRGVAATALDLNPAMCAYARERAAREGVAVDVVRGDMTAFALGRRFDLVVTMLDSTSHLMTLDAFVAHLDRAAEHLAPGGLYVVEMSHPRDRLGDPSVGTAWTVERDGVRASVRWGGREDVLDPVTQIAPDRVVMTIESGAEPRTIRDVVPYRFWTATELAAAVRLSGRLEIAAQYGDFGDVPVTDAAAWRMISVLRQPSGAQPGIG
ncbi:methyltransferase domain-containing protein [Actinomadura rayongensis]|uniref:Methyltransferase domain-containing protein n=1 Tax=Actinomadura rayongensis TaxID=1429076 RepID=A0A6I4WEZ1_9ACTN|nr:methyltransferase domain-containing protein [Actinomadura rayongensis]